MGTNRVKIFVSMDIGRLQTTINEWLEKNATKIMDVKNISITSGHNGEYLGNVFYILHR